MKLSTTMMINEKLLPTGKRAFTLAEVLITLSILGVVAAMTIPTLVNRQSDIAAQTRLKKAISNYHDLVEVYMLESGQNNAASMFGASCADAGQYFKMTKQDGCDIITADGARWFIDTATGNAVIYDADGASPRYGVVVWNANGFVNSDQCVAEGAGNACGTTVAPPAAAANTVPTNGFYNAKEFIASSGAQLKAKNTAAARTTVATAVAVDANAANGANGTGTGLTHAIAAGG